MKKSVKMIPLAASLVAMLMVSGCSNSDFVTDATVTGSVFDGAINGATVCIDVNANKACDSGEPTATTDVFGDFTMDGQGAIGALLMSGGKDMGTGKAFTGTLTAPTGSTVVSPLTSAIQSLIETGATPAAAEKSIKKALNIESTASLTSYNPFTEAVNGDGDTDAKEILAAQSQLQTLVHAVSSSIADVDAGTTIADAMADAMSNIATSLETAATLAGDNDVVISNKLVSDAVKSTANTVLKDKPAAQVAVKSVASAVAVAAIAVADTTKANVEAADITVPGAVALASNAGMLVANDAMQTTISNSTVSAAKETAKLSVAEVAEIQTAQVKQEDADKKIVAEAVKVVKAEVAAKEAADAAAKPDATKEEIVAAEEAKAEQAKAEAEVEAAKAAKEAAALEGKVATIEAAAKQKAADLAEAAAEAAVALAEAEKKAAEDAAKAAKAAEDAAEAKAAAEKFEKEHAGTIAREQAKADAAAKEAADAAKVLEEEARKKAEAAVKAAEEEAIEAEKLAKEEADCAELEWNWNPEDRTCTKPVSPTGAVS